MNETTQPDIGEMNYSQMRKYLDSLIEKGITTGKLTRSEQDDYDYLCDWYEMNHRSI